MEMSFDKILIAVDDSNYSVKAVRTGFSLAKKVNAEVAMVYVINKTLEVDNPDAGITSQQSRVLLLNQAERSLKQYISMFDGEDSVLQFTPSGIPEVEIVNVANEWGANLIVMGTHGRSAVGRILSGSVAEYVIRHVTVPVLVATPRME